MTATLVSEGTKLLRKKQITEPIIFVHDGGIEHSMRRDVLNCSGTQSTLILPKEFAATVLGIRQEKTAQRGAVRSLDSATASVCAGVTS